MSEIVDTEAATRKYGPDQRRPFRILSLDGGGIRGAFTAAFLQGLEDELGRSIASSFDLIAGTSTGGIIAVALAMGLSARQVVEMYQFHGETIFTRRRRSLAGRVYDMPSNMVLKRFGLDREWLRRAKYDSTALAAAVRSVLQDKTLNDAQRRLVVPAVRTSLGRPIVFRTPHLPNQVRDRHLTALDVILATTAAPTYFPPHWIADEHAEGQYVDGGLWANNPSLLAYVESIRISRDGLRPGEATFTADDVMVLSLGTGESPLAFRLPEDRSGVFRWAPRLLDLMMTSQSLGTNRMLRYLLPGGRFHRVNFTHCGEGWELDAVGQLKLLIANGRAEARNLIGLIPRDFFDGEAPHFDPFPPPER